MSSSKPFFTAQCVSETSNYWSISQVQSASCRHVTREKKRKTCKSSLMSKGLPLLRAMLPSCSDCLHLPGDWPQWKKRWHISIHLVVSPRRRRSGTSLKEELMWRALLQQHQVGERVYGHARGCWSVAGVHHARLQSVCIYMSVFECESVTECDDSRG